MKRILTILAILLANYVFSQASSENYLLKGIGYISIPTNMELQSGNFKKLAEEYQHQHAKKVGFEISDNRIVFQQKGLNSGEISGFSSYARVILETTIGNFGNYEKLTTKLSASEDELKELSQLLESEIKKSFTGTGLKLISWYGAQIVSVNGRTALKFSYLRKLNDNPNVTVSVYQFHNNDRMHQLTMSYRQQDAETWKNLYTKVLNSFTITSVR